MIVAIKLVILDYLYLAEIINMVMLEKVLFIICHFKN
jgi:hypothetical protein